MTIENFQWLEVPIRNVRRRAGRLVICGQWSERELAKNAQNRSCQSSILFCSFLFNSSRAIQLAGVSSRLLFSASGKATSFWLAASKEKATSRKGSQFRLACCSCSCSTYLCFAFFWIHLTRANAKVGNRIVHLMAFDHRQRATWEQAARIERAHWECSKEWEIEYDLRFWEQATRQ